MNFSDLKDERLSNYARHVSDRRSDLSTLKFLIKVDKKIPHDIRLNILTGISAALYALSSVSADIHNRIISEPSQKG